MADESLAPKEKALKYVAVSEVERLTCLTICAE
jgi:hypothetical protein